jgi:hypothetical protein
MAKFSPQDWIWLNENARKTMAIQEKSVAQMLRMICPYVKIGRANKARLHAKKANDPILAAL